MLLSISESKIYLPKMNVCFLVSKQTVKSICHKLSNLGNGWHLEGSRARRMPEGSLHLLLYSKDIDYNRSVVELSVGNVLLNKTDPFPALAEQDDTLDK